MIRRFLPPMIIMLWILSAVTGQLLDLDIASISLQSILQGPVQNEWMGYDELGRSVMFRLLEGASVSLIVAFGVVSVSALLGSVVGVLSAWAGGWLDMLVTRIMDVFLAFPGILLAIGLAGILGPGLENVIIALATVGWVGFARLARAQVLTIREREHVQAALALGTGHLTIMLRHLLPLATAPLIVEATFAVAAVVLAEAGLSFLGLGVQAPAASWGSMIREGARYMLVAPHLVLAPGMAIFFVVLAVNLLGDQLRDRLDIRLRVGKVRAGG